MSGSKKAKSKKAPAKAPPAPKRSKELRDDELASVSGGTGLGERKPSVEIGVRDTTIGSNASGAGAGK
jgi:bacteriocin-like protein